MYTEMAPPYTFPASKDLELTAQFANLLLCSTRLKNVTFNNCSLADRPK
jgi:hypothetical protein